MSNWTTSNQASPGASWKPPKNWSELFIPQGALQKSRRVLNITQKHYSHLEPQLLYPGSYCITSPDRSRDVSPVSDTARSSTNTGKPLPQTTGEDKAQEGRAQDWKLGVSTREYYKNPKAFSSLNPSHQVWDTSLRHKQWGL